MTQTSSTTQVIIVGAGLAGLTAAYRLSQQGGVRVEVLEASPRAGGRVFAELWPEANMFLELGGTWLLPSFTHSLALLDELGVPTQPSPEPEVTLTHFADGVKTRRQLTVDEQEQLRDFLVRLAQYLEQHPDATAAQALRQVECDPVLAGWLIGIQRFLAGADFETLDAAHLALDWEELLDPEHYRTEITGTSKAVVDALLKRLADNAAVTVHYNTPVRAVAQNSDGVRVETTRGRVFQGQAVIVAAPLNLLGDITFTPTLPEPLGGFIAAGHVGRSRKDWLLLRQVPDSFRVLAGTQGPYGYLRSMRSLPDGRVLAVGFSEANAALDPDELPAALREYFPEVIVEGYLSYDWNGQPYSQGAWFAPGVGQMAALEQLASESAGPSEGRVYFAGGDFSAENPGTIEGAIAQGEQAAARVAAVTAQLPEG